MLGTILIIGIYVHLGKGHYIKFYIATFSMLEVFSSSQQDNTVIVMCDQLYAAVFMSTFYNYYVALLIFWGKNQIFYDGFSMRKTGTF